MENIKFFVAGCALLASVGAFADNLNTPDTFGTPNTFTLTAWNNSGETLVYRGQEDAPYSTCQITGSNGIVPANSYFIVQGTYSTTGGGGLQCIMQFATPTLKKVLVHIYDPTKYYGGSADYTFYFNGVPVSGELPVHSYQSNDPVLLEDKSDTVVVGAF